MRRIATAQRRVSVLVKEGTVFERKGKASQPFYKGIWSIAIGGLFALKVTNAGSEEETFPFAIKVFVEAEDGTKIFCLQPAENESANVLREEAEIAVCVPCTFLLVPIL
jgi:hypothetical protein